VCGVSVAAAAAAAAAMATGERGSGARKFEATPEFVAGGPLHPYQLEGLNWLYHKAQVRDEGLCCDQSTPTVCACAVVCLRHGSGVLAAAALLTRPAVLTSSRTASVVTMQCC
jgi:hypothetical protein